MTNVLIVEDEQAIRRFLRTALEGDGMRVFEAETLQRGLLEAATRKPDLIILDLGLPDGDGIEFIRDLRQWSAVPVIVLSARSEESDKIAALDAGADDYLSKPFGIGELQARLRVALRRHSATTTARKRCISHRLSSACWPCCSTTPEKCSPSASYSIRCGDQTRSNTATICVFIWGICDKNWSKIPPVPAILLLKPVLGIGLCHELLFNKYA